MTSATALATLPTSRPASLNDATQSAGVGKISSYQLSCLRQFLQDHQTQTLAHIQDYLLGSLGVKYSISGISSLCQRLKIKPKTGRPVRNRMPSSLLKKFDQLRADYTDEAILFHDELRAGTHTELGRKWAPLEHRPAAPVKIGYENVYLYLTLCPFTGEDFAAFLPKLDGEQFGWFIEQVQACVGRKALFIADGATAHKAELFDKEKFSFVRLPAA